VIFIYSRDDDKQDRIDHLRSRACRVVLSTQHAVHDFVILTSDYTALIARGLLDLTVGGDGLKAISLSSARAAGQEESLRVR
jgi:hypothetical protein